MAVYTLSHVAVPSSLDEDLTAVELDIDVVDASTWPTADFLVRINLEVIDIESRTGNTLTVRSGGRGVGDTIGAIHSTSDVIEHVLDVQDLPFRRTVGSTQWEAQGRLTTEEVRIASTTVLDASVPAALRIAESDLTKTIQLGYDETNDYGAISVVDTGTSWKPLVLNPVAGNVGIHTGATAPTLPLEVGGAIGLDGSLQFSAAGVIYSLDGDMALRAQSVAAAESNFGLYVDDAAGTPRIRIYADGSGAVNLYGDTGLYRARFYTDDLQFYKADGSTISLLWDESDDRWEFGTNLVINDNMDLVFDTSVNSFSINTAGDDFNLFDNLAGQIRLRTRDNDDSYLFEILNIAGTIEYVFSATGVALNGNFLIGPGDPTAGTHVGDRDYNDLRYALGAAGDFVAVTGDTMTGPLVMATSSDRIEGSSDESLNLYGGPGADGARIELWSGDDATYDHQMFLDASTHNFRTEIGSTLFTVSTAFGIAINAIPLVGPLDPTAGTHVGDRDYNDARYLELDGTGTMAGDLNMGDYGLTNVRDITGRTNLTLSLLPGTGQELALKDDTGVIRIRVYDNAVGDIVFNDAAGALTFFWDESNGWFRMFSDLDMEDNNILGDGTNVLDGFQTVRNSLGALYFYSSPSAAAGDMRWYVSDSGGTDRLRMNFPTDGGWNLYDDTATFIARYLAVEGMFRYIEPLMADVLMQGSGNNPIVSTSQLVTGTFAAVTDQVGYVVIDMENGVGEDVLAAIEVTARGYWNAGNATGKQTVRCSIRYDHSPTPTVTVFETEYPVSFGYLKDNYKIGPGESWDDGGVEKLRFPVYKLVDATTSSLSIEVRLETANADQLHVAFHDSISWVAPVTVSNTETYQTTFFLDSGYVSNPMSVDLQMAGNDINDVGQLLGFAGQHISMQPRTGYESRLEDDAGIARVRVMPSATGDIIFTDTGGTATMWWDQSSTAWKVEDTLDLQNNHLWDVLRVTSTTGNLELYAIADATSADVVLAADDSGGVARFRQRIYGTGDIVWYKVDGTTDALRWDESEGSLDITGFMDVTGQIQAHGGLLADGAYIGDVAGIYSIDTAMRVEAYSSGASSQNIQFWADDSAGDSIKRVDIYGAGDIQMWREDGITSIFSWDESAATLTLVAANGFSISGDMNMLDSKITDINSLEADGTLPIVVDGNTVASFNDSGAGGELTLYGEGTVEGGQITIEGGSLHGTDWIFDRYQDRLRFLYGGSTKFGIRSDKMTFGGDGDYGLGSVTGQGGTYGTVATVGTGAGSYEGYSINGDFVFMSNSSTVVGIYDDTANQWLWRTDGTTTYMKHNNGELILNAVENSYIQLHHNNLVKLTTVTGGVDIEGAVTFSGVDNWGINGGDDFNVTENGAVRFRIRDDYNDGYHEFLGTNGTIIATISTDDFSVKGAVRAGLGTESALTNGYFYGIIPTTGSAANAYWAVASGSTYYALRFSSSERYKKEIKTFKGKIDGTEVSIFNLTPSVYRGSEGTPVYEDIPVEELEEDPDRPGTYKGDTYIHKKDKDGHFLYRHDFNDHLSIGLIAEDVAENFPSAAVYDEAGRPESVDWNNIIAGMLYEMQIMREEIDALKAAA